jgi:hypothetical protein
MEILNTPKPCVMSGFCCIKTPCGYGEWNDDKSACKYLAPPNDIGQRGCERFDWIKENVPGWEVYPAFGAGCCMPLFNTLRQDIIKKLHENPNHEFLDTLREEGWGPGGEKTKPIEQ